MRSSVDRVAVLMKLLGFPLWIGYAAMTPGLALTSATALYSAALAWDEARR